MAEIYDQIKTNYYQDEPDTELPEGAMKGMVSDLDPHSEYMDKKGHAGMEESTSGGSGGLGMEIGQEGGFIKVATSTEDTLAERAGVKSGDPIVKIDNTSTRDLTTSEAVRRICGKPDTKITLTLSRKNVNKPIVVSLIRAIIRAKSVRHYLPEKDYGYIRVSQSQERTIVAPNKAAQAPVKENRSLPEGIIPDLRDDPGGLPNDAVGVPATFLQPDMAVVSTKGHNKKEGMVLKAIAEDYIATNGKDPLAGLFVELRTIPMTILTSAGSTSASEIVTGALQDHRRTVVISTQSFGKGSVQTLIPLSGGSTVKLTTVLYHTPNDHSIQAQGIASDVEVKDKNRVLENRETDLVGHIGNPLDGQDVNSNTEALTNVGTKADKDKSKKDKDEDTSSHRIPNPAKDDQFRKALDLVKNPAEWQKSLGLAAKKPVPKKGADKSSKK